MSYCIYRCSCNSVTVRYITSNFVWVASERVQLLVWYPDGVWCLAAVGYKCLHTCTAGLVHTDDRLALQEIARSLDVADDLEEQVSVSSCSGWMNPYQLLSPPVCARNADSPVRGALSVGQLVWQLTLTLYKVVVILAR